MTKTKRIKHWVLKDGDLYFRDWTGCGPRTTRELQLAERFRTKQEAMQSLAYSFGLTGFEPEAIQ